MEEAGEIYKWQLSEAGVLRLQHGTQSSPPAFGEAQPLRLLPSEQVEAEIKLVCVFLLLMVLHKAISFAHF